MKKSELYKSIAAKHAPTDATIVPVEDTGDGHRGRTWPQLGRIEVPEPNTVGRLWLNLHEFAHWKLHRNAKPSTHTRAQLEAEADLASMKIMDEEGVRIPFHVLNTEEGCLHYVTLEERGKEQPPVVAECLEEIRGRTKAAANEL